jgi:hypothetical protein
LANPLHLVRIMTKPILAAALLLGACAANTPMASLTGTWTGTATNNSTTQYTFRDDGTFQYGIVGDAGAFLSLMTGSFSHDDSQDVTLDAVFTDPTNGLTSNSKVQFESFYADDTSLCDAAFISEDATFGSIIGSFTSSMVSQPLDASGDPAGDPSVRASSISFNNDGTFSSTDAGGMQTGTYTMAGSKVTTSIAHNNVAAVENFGFVGGIALCDPVYTKQ